MKKSAYSLLGLALLFVLGIGTSLFVRDVIFSNTGDSEPIAPQNLISEGDILYDQQRYSEALAKYEEALQKKPLDSTIHARIGQVYQLKNRYSDAEEHFLIALEQDPDNVDLLYRLASMYYDLTYLEQAQEYAEEALESSDQIPDAQEQEIRSLLGLTHLNQGHIQKGINHLSKSLEMDPSDHDVRYILSVATALIDTDLAISGLTRVINNSEDESLVTKSKSARQTINQMVNIGNEAQRLVQRGSLVIEHNLPALAISELKHALDIQPDYQAAQYYLGRAYFLIGDITNAKQYLEAALVVTDTPDSILYYYLGELYAYQGEYEKAIDAYERAIAAGDSHVETYSHLGHQLRISEEYTKAARAYERALEIEPTNVDVRTSLIYILLEFIKDYDEAINVAQEGLQLDANNAYMYSLLGWGFLRKGEYDHAEEQLLQAIQIDPSLPGAYYNMGELEEYRGNIDLAIEYYQKALDYDFKGDIAPLADAALSRLY